MSHHTLETVIEVHAPQNGTAQAELSSHLEHNHDPDTAFLADLLLTHAPPPARADRRERRRVREMLLAPEYQRIQALEEEVAHLQAQLRDKDALIAVLAPAISQAISQRVQEARDEVAEALYPVIGRIIQRAVTEAMRDLARRIDITMRHSLRFTFFKRLRLWLRGVKPEEVAMRRSLPFQVCEIFLIHRESGLLMQHLSAVGTLTDADLISGMLTAIRSYVRESFDLQTDNSLDAIEYGDLNILIEEDRSALLAVVLQGVQPAGFRSLLRQQLMELHRICGPMLRNFKGDPIDESRTLPLLRPLMEFSDASA